MGTPFVRLWMCKTGSISERLTRDPFGSLLDVQIWFNIWASHQGPSWTSVDVQNWFNIWTSHSGPSWTSSGRAKLVQYLNVSLGTLLDVCGRAKLVQYLNVWYRHLLDVFWTCKTGSISERLTGTPLGHLLDMQNWFNICIFVQEPSWTSVDMQNYFNIWASHGCLWMCNTSNSNCHPAPMCALPTALLHVHQRLHILTPLSSSKLTDDITLSFRTVTSLLTNRISKSWLSGAVATTRSWTRLEMTLRGTPLHSHHHHHE